MLIDAAAKTAGGQAYHFAVNTDSPKHLALKWPGRSLPLTDDPAATSAEWSGQLAPPSPAHIAMLADAFAADSSAWSFKPLVDPFLRTLRRQSLDAQSLDAAMVYAMHELDWQLGLRHHAMLLSPLLQSEPYLTFVYHLLSRGHAVAEAYNAALADYRGEHGIKNAGRPMPDLAIDEARIEAPFWLDDLSAGTRLRAGVAPTPDASRVLLRAAGGAVLELDSTKPAEVAISEMRRWLIANELQIAPRALTLTMFLRLFIADQFVHGIGGGRYDQVTDRLILRMFGFSPPRYAVATATQFFPTAVDQPRACLPCLEMEGHQLRHRVLGDEKAERVRAIAEQPRRSLARARAFSELQDALRSAPPTPALIDWEKRRAAAAQQHSVEAQLYDRELFYALQPSERLNNLIDRIWADLK